MLAGIAIGVGSLLIYVDFDVLAFFEGLTGMTRRWSSSLARGRYGSWRTILYEMQMFLQAVIPIAVCLAASRRAAGLQRLVAAVFVLWMSVRILFSGSRGGLLPIAMCVAACCFGEPGLDSLRNGHHRNADRSRRRLRARGNHCRRSTRKIQFSAAIQTDYVGFEMFRELYSSFGPKRRGCRRSTD